MNLTNLPKNLLKVGRCSPCICIISGRIRLLGKSMVVLYASDLESYFTATMTVSTETVSDHVSTNVVPSFANHFLPSPVRSGVDSKGWHLYTHLETQKKMKKLYVLDESSLPYHTETKNIKYSA